MQTLMLIPGGAGVLTSLFRNISALACFETGVDIAGPLGFPPDIYNMLGDDTPSLRSSSAQSDSEPEP